MIVRTRRFRWTNRMLCWLLAVVMATSQSVWVLAQQPQVATDSEASGSTRSSGAGTGQLDLAYCTDRAFAAVSVHPRRLLTAPALELMPVEVVTAAGLEHLGFDPVEVESAEAFIEPPTAGGVTYAVVLKLAKPFRVEQLKPQVREHTFSAEIEGKQYLRSGHPMLPSFYMPDEKTLVAASDSVLRRVVSGRNDGVKSSLIDHLKTAPVDSDAYVAVDLEIVRPMIALGIGAAKESGEIPPEFAPFLNAPSMIRTVDLAINIVTEGPSHLAVHANDEGDAKKLEDLIQEGLEMYRQQMMLQARKLQESDDPIERAGGQYMQRVSERLIDLYRPAREGETFYLFKAESGGEQQQLYTVAIIGVLVALLLPAVQAAREAARRTQCANNFRQLMLALHTYADTHGRFPAQANYDQDGKPLLSWRVHILPMVGEQALYDQFHLDEPWDSPHNKTLVARMPALFRCPSSPMADPGKTTYLAASGKGLFMDGKEGLKVASIRDGTSRTIALVEVADEHAVIWTKPEDLEYDPKQPMAKLGSFHPGIFTAAFCDGSVRAMEEGFDIELLKAMFTCNGDD